MLDSVEIAGSPEAVETAIRLEMENVRREMRPDRHYGDTWYLDVQEDESGGFLFIKAEWPTMDFGFPPGNAKLEYRYDPTKIGAVVRVKFNVDELPSNEELARIAKEFAGKHRDIPEIKTVALLRVLRDQEKQRRKELYGA